MASYTPDIQPFPLNWAMDARYSGKGGVRTIRRGLDQHRNPLHLPGQVGHNAVIPTSGLVPVTVNVAHESEVQLEFGGGLPRLANGVVDVVNDRLS